MTKWVLILIASAGMALIIANLFLLVCSLINKNRHKVDRFKATIKLKDAPKAMYRSERIKQEKESLISMVVGSVFLTMLLYGIVSIWISIIFGGAIGVVVRSSYLRIKKSSHQFALVKELALLYECIEFFTRAGFTVRQSLEMGQTIVPYLQKHIRTCLDQWSFGPLRALEKFGEDIGIDQANILVSLLMQIEESGTKNIAGAMEQESMRLEEIREALAEARIAKKPIYSAVYMFLPVASLLGILIAPLAYRAIQMISNISAGGM